MAQEMTATAGQVPERRGDGEAMRSAMKYRPDTDIFETDDHVVVTVDMPGVAPVDVDITLDRRVLSIRGRISAGRHDDYRQVYAEYGEGDFERVFTLSEDIDRDGIKATQKDGVLMLELPKSANARAKKISVMTA